MPTSPTKRRPITVSSLLEAAEFVFADRGFHGASIGEICARAGLTRGAFYSNFADKDELLFALLDRHEDALIAERDADLARLHSSDDPITELGLLLSRYDETRRRSFLVARESILHSIREPHTARRLLAQADRTRARFGSVLGDVLNAAGREATIELGQLTDIVSALVDSAHARHFAHRSAGRRGHTRDHTAIPVLLRELSRPIPVADRL